MLAPPDRKDSNKWRQKETIMTTAPGLIEVERRSNALVLTPQRNLSDLDYEGIEEDRNKVLNLLEEDKALRNLVWDLGKTDYFGSTAIGLFVRLGQQVQDRHGHMAFCNVSDLEVEILNVTGLAKVWSIYLSREEALAAVNSYTPAPEGSSH
jgi:stage II sporulation protein AA (anti-sigma F factor antagonist)